MGWQVGYDDNWQRDIGYGVPSICDHPDCNVEIDRGLSHVCGSDPYGGEYGCGLYFCSEHLSCHDRSDQLVKLCQQCGDMAKPFKPKPDTAEWTNHKASDPSWAAWRADQGISNESGSANTALV